MCMATVEFIVSSGPDGIPLLPLTSPHIFDPSLLLLYLIVVCNHVWIVRILLTHFVVEGEPCLTKVPLHPPPVVKLRVKVLMLNVEKPRNLVLDVEGLGKN